ncbi:MAG: phosphatidylserine decarboxylase family protein [Planctomycetes bacterium]|nr:phosphatidylserine decarboxylase family protein [Planctomycetota bacterium]
MRLTRYGIREIICCTLALWALGAAGVWLSCRCGPTAAGLEGVIIAAAGWLLIAVSAIVWLWVLAFFRDPDRKTPQDPGLLVSPADGVVTDITPLGAESPLGRPGVQVGIFMSIFNVHVNRSPCDGRVEKIEHRDGAFLDVRRDEAWSANESATIHLSYRHGQIVLPVIVRQIAGLLARRIVTGLRTGEEISRGQRIGMIKFGSRLELLAPVELSGEVRVAVGQKVFAGLTVLLAAGPAGDRPQQT